MTVARPAAQAQVERVLNQLHMAETSDVLPFVYLGRKVLAPPTSCGVGENQYFDGAHGANVWEYFFEQATHNRRVAAI